MDECKPMEEKKVLLHFAERKPVDIEFHDLSYVVPQGRKGEKRILKSISGQFKAGQLHAIMGPSGAGKSTLLNILATYKLCGSSGTVLVNGEPRNVRTFRKISRYIMQQDALQPLLSVQEIMMMAADFKLSKGTTKESKNIAIAEILEMLRLTNSRNTVTERLSGGERKRLSIALELLNNPPVIFLDEPTTGLDDLSSYQCIQLLKTLTEGGRTIICSIHTPSAKLFSTFDNAYVLAEGYCVYQGFGPDVVPFLANMGLPCPTHFNPADFVIEVCSGDYGNYLEALVAEVDNGRSISYYKRNMLDDISRTKETINVISDTPYNETTVPYEESKHRSSSFTQFQILIFRMWLQMYRDKGYLFLRFIMTIGIGLVVGNLYVGMGQDASKTLFNFGFYYTCIIKFLYIPMMPVLTSFPLEIQTLKREAFNKWYRLTPYFWALTLSTIPMTLILGAIYVALVYAITDQPFEWSRIIQFYTICMITAMASESLGLLIASNLNVLNAMFVGPVLAVPLMLLAVYGIGFGETPIPVLIKIVMHFSYLRYAMEGLTIIMTENRPTLHCPDTEEICVFRNLKEFALFMKLADGEFWFDALALTGMFLLFRFGCFYLIKQRLRPNKAFRTLRFLLRTVKVHFNMPL